MAKDAIPSDLGQLLAALRGAPDSWSRLKLVAGGARTLAKLTPAQRVQLLRQLGLQGAEELAEAAAGGDSQTAAAMTQALKALEADPQRLKQLASAIADPNSRRATLMGLGAHVMETVTAPPPPRAGKGQERQGKSAAVQPPRAASPATGTGRGAQPPAGGAARAAVVEAAAALLTGVAATGQQPPAPPGQPATPQPPAQPATLPPTPHPSPSPQPPAPPQPTPPVAPPAAPPTTPPSTPPSLPQPVHPTTPPAPTASAPVVETSPSAEPAWPEIAASSPAPAPVAIEIALYEPNRAADPRPAALGTLRDLRRRLAAGDSPEAGELTTLFAAELPQGWARRRALAALFAERRPEALDDALALVAQVGSPVDRRWALADLARSRPWADGDWERLVAAAGGAGERRRLAMRRRRA